MSGNCQGNVREFWTNSNVATLSRVQANNSFRFLGDRLTVHGEGVDQSPPRPQCGQTNTCGNITFPRTTYVVRKYNVLVYFTEK